MIDLKFSKQRFKDHFYYSKWLYVLFIIISLTTFSLVFTVTRPVVPKEFKVDISIIGVTLQDSEMNAWEEEILDSLSQDQQEVNIYAMGFSSGGEGSADYSAYEILAARMAANEGDVLIISKEIYLNIAQQGVLLELDDIVSKYDFPEELDLEEYSILIEDEDYSDGKSHTYGLPVDGVLGLVDLGVDPTDKVMVVMVYTKNSDNAIKAVDYIMNKTESELIASYQEVAE